MVRLVAVTDTDSGFKKITIDLVKLGKSEVLVGVQEGAKTLALSERGRIQKPGISIAGYAAKNEFGTKTIPQRSFMRSFFDENLNIIEPFIERRYDQIIEGKKTVDQGLGEIGLFLQDGIKTKIRQIRTPENSKKTIAKKRSSKPLIDFGNLFASIRYLIKTRKR